MQIYNRLDRNYSLFTKTAHYLQIAINDCVDEAHVPNRLTNPFEPSPQSRELHKLTHMPYRSWCPLSVRTKGRGDYRKQVYDKRPVFQVDYAFLVDNTR